MRLKSIRLKNFKCYTDFEQGFELGITSVCGENGVGKSSILEGISWALFNFLPYSANSRIIKIGAKNAEVDLRVISSLDGREYSIRRKTAGQSMILDVADKSAVTEGVGNMQSWVRAQLNLRASDNLSAICKNGIATPQGALTSDFTESPENRRKIFDQLLGLEDFKTVNNNLAELTKSLGEQSVELRVELGKAEFIEEQLKGVKSQKDEKTKEYNLLQQSLIQLESSLKAKEKVLSEQRSTIEKIEVLENSESALNQRIAELKENIKDLSLIQSEHAELKSKADDYKTAKELKIQLEPLRAESGVLEKNFSQMSEALKFERENLKRLNEEIGKVEISTKAYDELKEKLLLFQAETEKQKQLINRQAELKAALNRLDENKKQFEQKLSEIAEISGKIKEIEAYKEELVNLDSWEQELESLRNDYSRTAEIEKEKEKISAKLTQTYHSRDELKGVLNSQETRLKEINNEVSSLEALIEVNASLLPKLAETGVCPILREPCKNLEGKQNHLEASLNEELETQKIKLKQLKIELLNLEKEIDNNKIHLAILEQLHELEVKLAGKNSQTLMNLGKELRVKVEDLRKKKISYENISELQNRLSELEKRKVELHDEITLSETFQKSLEEVESEKTQCEGKITELKVFADKALILKSETEKKSHLEMLQKTHLERTLVIEQDLSKMEKRINELQPSVYSLKEAEAKITELEPANLKFTELDYKLASMIEDQRKLIDLTEELAIVAKSLSELKQFGFSKARIIEDENQLKEELKSLHHQQGNLTALQKTVDELALQQTKLTNDLESLNLKRKNLSGLLSKQETIQKLRGAYKETAVRLAGEYVKHIGSRATKLFREIMQDSSFEIEWTEDYEITVIKNAQPLSFEVLSGGQQIAAAISLRLALLQEISDIKFAFFDEPTAHLDVERRNQLAMQIAGIKSFDQLFVITHDESFASQANNVIYLSREENELN
jgi:exonuclease SbcC